MKIQIVAYSNVDLFFLFLDLVPNTEYLVSVMCVYEQRQSSPVVGIIKTGDLK